jgi:hypothetical protein
VVQAALRNWYESLTPEAHIPSGQFFDSMGFDMGKVTFVLISGKTAIA